MKKDNDVSLKQDHDDEYLYTIKTICGILEWVQQATSSSGTLTQKEKLLCQEGRSKLTPSNEQLQQLLEIYPWAEPKVDAKKKTKDHEFDNHLQFQYKVALSIIFLFYIF